MYGDNDLTLRDHVRRLEEILPRCTDMEAIMVRAIIALIYKVIWVNS